MLFGTRLQQRWSEPLMETHSDWPRMVEKRVCGYWRSTQKNRTGAATNRSRLGARRPRKPLKRLFLPE